MALSGSSGGSGHVQVGVMQPSSELLLSAKQQPAPSNQCQCDWKSGVGRAHTKGKLPAKLQALQKLSASDHHFPQKSLQLYANPSVLIGPQSGGTFVLTCVNNWDACGTVLFCTGSHHRREGCSGDFADTCGRSRILTKRQIVP